MRLDADSPDSAALRSRSNRVSRACDRCRIRKIKCNGKSQCSRCALDDAVCVYTKRRRPNDRAYSKEYVQLLEEQQVMLIKGVKELYRRSSRGEPLPDLPRGTGDSMLIHEVLASLNVLPESQDIPESDHASLCEDFSATSSVCGSATDDSFLPDADWQLDPPTLTTSPTSADSRDVSASPQVPTMAELEGIISQFDAERLGIDTLPGLIDPTPRAIEMSFQEAFSDVYLMGQDLQMHAKPAPFVNPRDTSYVMPMHLSRMYTT